jgi:hypothetical protein
MRMRNKLTREQDVADIPQVLLHNVHIEASSLFPALQRVALHWLLARWRSIFNCQLNDLSFADNRKIFTWNASKHAIPPITPSSVRVFGFPRRLLMCLVVSTL